MPVTSILLRRGAALKATVLSSRVGDSHLQVGGRRTPIPRAPCRGRREDLPDGDAGRARGTAPALPHPNPYPALAERPGTAFLPSQFLPARVREVSDRPARRAGADGDAPVSLVCPGTVPGVCGSTSTAPRQSRHLFSICAASCRLALQGRP